MEHSGNPDTSGKMVKVGDGVMYSEQLVTFILSHFWELKAGKIPHETSAYARRRTNAQDTPQVWIADLDLGIDKLSKRYEGRWLSVCDKLTPARLEKIKHKFSHWQQLLFNYYLLGYPEAEPVKRVVRTLRYKMNAGTKEAELVDAMLHSIKAEE